MSLKPNVFIALLLLVSVKSFSQLGFCTGSKGDPVFTEDFGTGTGFGPALPAGTTNYNFVSGVPNDGEYTLSSTTMMNGNWVNRQDHTPSDTNGKAFIVNASFTAGEFYRRQVTGLCVNTTFEFSAWLINAYNPSSNACGGSGIPINVKFQIWDQTETQLLKEGDTGNINGSANADWMQYGMTFTVLPGQTSVVLKMLNNGVGGCGNDLAIDDITFRSCGDLASVTSGTAAVVEACSNELPTTLNLQLNISGSGTHVFQWQSSPDGNTWTDIAGETSQNYATPPLMASGYYRVKIAEDIANMNNAYCYTLSDSFHFFVLPQPAAPVFIDDVESCSNDSAIPPLTVSVPAGITVDWYDAPSSGNLLQSASASYQTNIAGTYYAEAVSGSCTSPTRTAVTLSLYPSPEFPDIPPALAEICQGNSTILDAGMTGVTYDWQPGGETTQTISVTQSGIYTLTVTSPNGCTDSQQYGVIVHEAPQIASVNNQGSTVTVTTVNTGNFEYSLDQFSWQFSNVFHDVEGGLITVYVRDIYNCGSDDMQYLLIVPPTFFTPNGDNVHDVFTIKGIEFTTRSKVAIFDRYGKFIKMLTPSDTYWDGTLNGKQLPSTDYWYRGAFDDGKEIRGHFSLKR
ncbi:T9SS type B sorting domain-containing protein [Flavobacterium sp. MAH-1]|uniref:T9SS type B sorting domain-containing protein n=1 Tax=Flavobacterium agri TaxID=2743471 RepID=UPI00158902B0|nr:T9SS type B sorting domain-containing protein [Flavobacterium agri]NUY82395.1 T9SS type B sorting domain-containing protein [Flavobacterium agri]